MNTVKTDRPASGALRVGVDTGGTFTDCVSLGASGAEIRKVFSTPEKIAGAAVRGIAQLLDGRSSQALTILHGTTVGTNTLLERRGARVALVTTAGFEDLIEIGRQNRPHLYDLNVTRDPALVPRARRWGLEERTLANGSPLQPLSEEEVERVRREIERSGAESVALCLLFSYANPRHERAVARLLRGLKIPVSVSHELLPEFREYERLSTTVINACLAPVMSRYLAGFEKQARRRFQPARTQLRVMQSSGGIMTAAQAARQPVRTILSGPAGGVVATAWLARRMGLRHVISFDMGGTSTDVCLIDGAPRVTRETTLAGLPVAVPMLDVHSVGAGGGSLARRDAGGALRVGPQSAGAHPGPVCYGRGGSQLTVTDAHVVLGRLDAAAFLGGSFALDRSAAERRFDEFIARNQPAWRAREHLAESIVRVCNATMEKALRVISVERGYDPRDYSLVCFGGAGGWHAAELARSLGLARVIIPPSPGAFSALGVLLSDIVSDVSQSALRPCPGESSSEFPVFRRWLDRRFERLEKHSRAALRRDGFDTQQARAERSLGLRYHGQSFELTIPNSPRFAEQFHRAHKQAYGYSDPARTPELVSFRIRLTIPTPKPQWPRHRVNANASARRAIARSQSAWFSGRFLRTPFYDRARLAPGMTFRGPAVVTEYSSTTVVPPGFACRVDEFLNLVMTRAAG